LAAVLCRIARDAGSEAVSFQLLLCPILDARMQTASRQELGEGLLLDLDTCKRDLELYVPQGCDLADPRLSPLRAEEFSGLAPAFIHTAQFDPFSEEGEAYAQRLGGFGVPVHGRCHPGMIHGFLTMSRAIPYALEALRIIGTEIRYAVRLPPLPERRMVRRMRPELVRI
jgi:acetyl esterase/lipase